MSMWDDDAGYDRDDPKHPDYADAMFDRADMARKREKEEAADFREKAYDRIVSEHEAGLHDHDDVVLGKCPHGVDLDREFCPHGCRV